MSAPSLAPTFDIDTYLVLDEIGTSRIYRETEETEADLGTILRGISEGQYSRPLRIVAFNTAEGSSRDLTEQVADELVETALRPGDPLTRSAREFIERVTKQDIPLAATDGH